MKDAAFELLKPELDKAPESSLWIADENLLNQLSRVNGNVQVITNRYDLMQQLQQAGWNTVFSDFDFSEIADHSLSRIVYRVSKEKPVVHHVINQAIRTLKPGGELCIAGLKNEGIKTYLDKAKKLFAGQIELVKSDKNTWMGVLQSPGEADTELLEDQRYAELREVAADEQYGYQSKPGVYGWNKVDRGSAYLAEELPRFLDSMTAKPDSILDLGCGYGYLSLQCAALLPDTMITATDNNAGAISACQANFAQAGIQGEVIADNCAEGVSEKYPMVICNPPFHQGFSTDGDLTDRFIASAHRHLQQDGIAAFVTNLHIPLERKAARWFKKIDIVADNGNFKLIRLAQPK